MKIVVQSGDQGPEAGLCLCRYLHQMDGEPAIAGISRKEGMDLLGKAGPCCLAGEKVANLGNPEALPRVVVVHLWKDIQVHMGRGDSASDLGLAINLTNRAVVDDPVG